MKFDGLMLLIFRLRCNFTAVFDSAYVLPVIAARMVGA